MDFYSFSLAFIKVLYSPGRSEAEFSLAAASPLASIKVYSRKTCSRFHNFLLFFTRSHVWFSLEFLAPQVFIDFPRSTPDSLHQQSLQTLRLPTESWTH